MRFKTLTSAIALSAGIAAMAAPAMADTTFTVNETTPFTDLGLTAPSNTGDVTADAIGMTYSGLITLAGFTGLTGSTGTFSETGSILATSLVNPTFSNGATHSILGVGGTNYELVGNIVSSSGTYTYQGNGSFTGTFQSFNADLYLVAPSTGTNLTKGTNGEYNNLTGTDSIEIATMSFVSQTQLLVGVNGAAPGVWDITEEISPISPQFGNYFISPSPFYVDLLGSGQNGEGGGAVTISGDTISDAGGGSLSPVPEPASLMLFGSGLMALGMGIRRRRKGGSV